ncbi:MAG: isochorismate synthase [Pseudomonadota bacterium]|nr:isochorismate synthase [Pseudomonadota bacterium]
MSDYLQVERAWPEPAPEAPVLTHVSETGANALLEQYSSTSSFFFASPRFTLLGEGSLARLTPRADGQIGTSLSQWLDELRRDGVPDPVAVGALPFEVDAPPLLYVPAQMRRAGRLQHARLAKPAPAATGCVFTERPGADAYADSVRQALQKMADSPLHKVVLARTLDVVSDANIDQAQLLRNLARSNPDGYSFAVDLPVAHRGCSPHRLIGASPELLLERRGTRVLANPIAGTLPRSRDPVEDARRCIALTRSAKDLHEHALVVDAVVEALRPHCRLINCPPRPEVISTATLWHLSTRVRAELRDPGISSLDLARALHPTPAVCGEPRALAREVIGELEHFPRGLFTGMVGWCDAKGDGEWAVTIRCAEVEAGRARLYAGAGIVPNSVPELEVTETAAKFRAMLDALRGDGP